MTHVVPSVPKYRDQVGVHPMLAFLMAYSRIKVYPDIYRYIINANGTLSRRSRPTFSSHILNIRNHEANGTENVSLCTEYCCCSYLEPPYPLQDLLSSLHKLNQLVYRYLAQLLQRQHLPSRHLLIPDQRSIWHLRLLLDATPSCRRLSASGTRSEWKCSSRASVSAVYPASSTAYIIQQPSRGRGKPRGLLTRL